jgi:hypothetical protein
VLWSVPARGSTLIRELRVFAQMAAGEAAESEAEAPPPADDGGLEVAGFVLSAETLGDLSALDLTALTLPSAPRRRVLLLGREAIAPDRRLRELLERSGADITTADGIGYGSMMTHPQLAETPLDTIALVANWLAEPADAALEERSPLGEPVATADDVLLSVGDTMVREVPLSFDFRGQRLYGVLAQPVSAPAAQLCVLLMNAGSVRRIGPNRMWVECARRWAAEGVTSLRLDGSGLGDSDGDERPYQRSAHFYRRELAEQVGAALDELQARGLPANSLVGGLCSGAYWGFQASLTDQRVRGLILINLWTFFWSEERAAAHDVRRALALMRSGAWRDLARIATSEGRIRRLARTNLRRVAHPGRPGGAPSKAGKAIDEALDDLQERGVDTLLLLSQGEPLLDELTALGRLDRLEQSPTLHFERIPIKDHIFRPVWAQEHVHRHLDEALARVLAVVDQDT